MFDFKKSSVTFLFDFVPETFSLYFQLGISLFEISYTGWPEKLRIVTKDRKFIFEHKIVKQIFLLVLCYLKFSQLKSIMRPINYVQQSNTSVLFINISQEGSF